MEPTEYRFKKMDLEKIDREVRKILEACERLGTLSRANGGIPAIDRNLDKITASVKNLSSAGLILAVLREEGAKVFKD